MAETMHGVPIAGLMVFTLGSEQWLIQLGWITGWDYDQCNRGIDKKKEREGERERERERERGRKRGEGYRERRKVR